MSRRKYLNKKHTFKLTGHAAEVIAQRRIHLDWIERALKHPEIVEPDAEDRELRHALARIPENGGRVLRVIYNEKTKPLNVVTAFFDRAMKGRL